jgi:hypothetical protein
MRANKSGGEPIYVLLKRVRQATTQLRSKILADAKRELVTQQ